MATVGAGITVRAAGPGDLLAVLGVHARLDADGHVPERATERQHRTWSRMGDVFGLCVYLAEIDGNDVGTASTMVFPNVTYDCHPTAIIEAVAVAHPFRRRGVATALLTRALTDLESEGCNKVQLLSHKRHADDGAHRLYTSLGFRPEAEGFRLYLGQIPTAVSAARSS